MTTIQMVFGRYASAIQGLVGSIGFFVGFGLGAVEAGVVAAILVVAAGWTLPFSLIVACAAMLPISVGQGFALGRLGISFVHRRAIRHRFYQGLTRREVRAGLTPERAAQRLARVA